VAIALHHRDTVVVRPFKFLLRGIVILIGALAASWFFLLHTQSGASWLWGRVEIAADGALSGEFIQGDFANGVEIGNIRLSAETVEVELHRVRTSINVDLFPLQANLSGVRLIGVTANVKAAEAENEGPTDVGLMLSGLRLPVRLDIADVMVEDVTLIIANGQPVSVEQVDASVSWHDEINIRRLEVRTVADSANVLGNINLVNPQSFEFAITASYENIVLQGNVTGNDKVAEAVDVIISGHDIDARGSAKFSWIDGLDVVGNLQVDRFEPEVFLEAWPGGHSLVGSLGFEVTDEYIRFSNSTVAVASSDMSMQFDAVLDHRASTVSADLNWLNLQWPIDATSPDIKSEDGKISVDGVLDEWKVRGSVAVSTREMTGGRFKIAGGGNRDRVALSVEDGRILGGSATGDVAYSWRGDRPWSASANFDEILTSSLLPDWPGEISGYASAEGVQTPFAIKAELQKIKGDIRELPFTADGSFAHSDEGTFADNLIISHGGARAVLDGSIDTPDGLAFRGSIDALEYYVDDASGSIEASGRISRGSDRPYLSLDLRSSDLLIGGVQMRGLRITDSRPEGAVAGFVLNVDELSAAGQEMVGLELTTTVRTDRQELRLTGVNRGTEFDLGIDGAFDDWRAVPDSPWRGRVSSLTVDLQDEHALHLEGSAALEISSEKFSLSDFCLGDEESSRLCVDVAREAGGQIDLQASLQDVPLALIEHASDTDLVFDQRVDGSLTWQGEPDSGATGSGEFVVSAGVVASSQRESLQVATGAGRLVFEITDGDLLSGAVTLPMPGVGEIDGEFKVLDLVQAADSEISGRLNVSMTDISIAAHFSPLIDSASGRVYADLDLSGTGSSPLLTGNVGVEGGALEYQPIGLRLDEIDLVGTLTENRAIELSGKFRAGDGYGEIVSSADYRDSEQPGIRFKIRGEELRIIDVPDIQLSVIPDVEISFGRAALDINGSVLIPNARIVLSNLAETRVVESEDVRIIAGRRFEDAQSVAADSKLTYNGALKIELGEQVVIDAGIAEANLKGSAVFNWQGDALPIVDGRYDLAGNIQAFGQVLRIAEGAIRFPNVPADEPDLRIRAEREIYGNSQVKRAGVLVDGAASHPRIEAYTIPLTTEERALTLLVTGSDFDYEQGVGAVDFGTYIAPRLFVSYGVGVFDRDNIISVRYDLTKGFGIKASSGSKASGLDLNYRIDN
jgi:translocation and assembly module TamB